MGSPNAKTLIPISERGTILDSLLFEAASARQSMRACIFVRNQTPELHAVLDQSPIDIDLRVREPTGYFRDLVLAQRELGLGSFAVVDSDLVVPPGSLAAFLEDAFTVSSWLTVGVTVTPEQNSGRPTWVGLDASDRIIRLSRSAPEEHRTLGVFRWSAAAFDGIPVPAPDASVMAYVAEHLEDTGGVRAVRFPAAVNVNAPSDIEAANSLVARFGGKGSLPL
jgi:GTP:adenosylcobinamide-phosphate guanylyltransferase